MFHKVVVVLRQASLSSEPAFIPLNFLSHEMVGIYRTDKSRSRQDFPARSNLLSNLLDLYQSVDVARARCQVAIGSLDHLDPVSQPLGYDVNRLPFRDQITRE